MAYRVVSAYLGSMLGIQLDSELPDIRVKGDIFGAAHGKSYWFVVVRSLYFPRFLLQASF